VVTSVDDNGTYHLAELDGMRITVPVAGKRVKAFKKRHDDEPDLGIGGDDNNNDGNDDDTDGDRRRDCHRDLSRPVFFVRIWRMPVDARLGGGGCREENRPGVESASIAGFGRVGWNPWETAGRLV
jgi:hypothetical protein